MSPRRLATGLVVLLLYLVRSGLPDWLQAPLWFRPLTHGLGHFLTAHQGFGLFVVIFLEELGIPLPAPGDVAITWGGYLTTTSAIPLPVAWAGLGVRPSLPLGPAGRQGPGLTSFRG